MQIKGMKNNSASWLASLFGSKESITKSDSAQIRSPQIDLTNSIGLDRVGLGVENPLRCFDSHALILGATGVGKTRFVQLLIQQLGCRILWLPGAAIELEQIHAAIIGNERFELPVLVIVDNAHLFADQLEMIELIARDGLKSNVLLLITAQLLSDLPSAVWRNCRIRFAIGQDAFEQLSLGNGPLERLEVAFSFPNRQGVLKPVDRTGFAPVVTTTNPLVRSASRPQSAPYEEFAPVRQIPLDQWSMVERAEPQDLHDRPRDSTDLPHRTRYSRTL